MKKKIIWRSVFALLGVVVFWYTTQFTTLFKLTDNHHQKVAPFLTTNWEQMGGFEKFTPGKQRIGCWGTAFSQIFYHHKLQPQGRVIYQCKRTKHKIDEDFSEHKFDWTSFVKEVNNTTSAKSLDEVALYSYYTATVLQKDFGSNFYNTKLPPVDKLEKHYKVSIREYISLRKLFPYTNSKLGQIVRKELDQKRPVYLYFGNMKDFGHAVVVDGYRWRNGKFWVHLIQGHGGPQNGWYNFHTKIANKDDTILRVIYTVKPVKTNKL